MDTEGREDKVPCILTTPNPCRWGMGVQGGKRTETNLNKYDF